MTPVFLFMNQGLVFCSSRLTLQSLALQLPRSMMTPTPVFLALAVISIALAQRPPNISICDYYSKALLGGSNQTTQYTLVTLLVNTAVIGNYTQPNKLAVPGILAPDANFNGTKVNLLQYFNGDLTSTNNGGKHGVAVNFLDGGGAAPLKDNKPANSKGSMQ